MKKIILILLISTSYIFANINAVVSILPLQTFLKAIGGENVTISLMVSPGNSPHTYEPKPSQMLFIAKANLYFAIDVEFEHVWLPKFQSLNPKMQLVDLTYGVKKSKVNHTHSHDDHHGEDPHIWTNPHYVKIIAKNIYNALVNVDAKHKIYYKTRLQTFLASVEDTDKQIRQILQGIQKRHFIVFHPSWGYFAKAYGLEQIAVEVEGKSPKPRAIIKLIKTARKHHVTAIFTQPEFSDTSAKILAHELKIPVVKKTPLAPNWSENLIDFAKIIAGKN